MIIQNSTYAPIQHQIGVTLVQNKTCCAGIIDAIKAIFNKIIEAFRKCCGGRTPSKSISYTPPLTAAPIEIQRPQIPQAEIARWADRFAFRAAVRRANALEPIVRQLVINTPDMQMVIRNMFTPIARCGMGLIDETEERYRLRQARNHAQYEMLINIFPAHLRAQISALPAELQDYIIGNAAQDFRRIGF